ncbi:hypothetical protein CPT_Marzo_121 [Stenotrophomonas phage Marzo]|nr:hypothetical protein CPT_Marzo_121 [Stenotrophomonas phage Marzo]
MVSLIYTSASTYKPKKKRKPKGEVFQKYKPDKSFKPLTTSPPRPIRQSDQYKSAAMPAAKPVLPVRYEGEMAEREAAAQREIERKKTMVAPMYSKGGYQYVGDVPPEIVKTLGRKV